MSIFPSKSRVEQYLFRRGGKYPVIAGAISCIHVVFLFFFHKIGIVPMVIYNLVCISGYCFFSAEAYKGNRIKEFFIFCITEIPLHAVLSTIYVGPDFHFMYVMFGAIPCLFYFIIFIDHFKHTIIFPTVVSFLYAFIFVGVKIYSANYAPLVTRIRNIESLKIFYTYFNIWLSFATLIFFNILTAIEYNYIKQKLITENSELDNFATFDTLTKLLNRRSTDAQLKRLYDIHYHDEDAFSIIMCDIDKFKNVNDTYGHDVGDYVLKEVAWILKDTVREGDIVGRWGGEEFLIILKCHKASAAALAERIRAKVESHTYTYNNITLHITLTLGVSSHHANTDIDSLIKSADKKLYRGKENGRNQVVT